jgi:hypothetical protein
LKHEEIEMIRPSNSAAILACLLVGLCASPEVRATTPITPLSNLAHTVFVGIAGLSSRTLSQKQFKRADPKIQAAINRAVANGWIGGNTELTRMETPDLSQEESISAEQFSRYFQAVAYEKDQWIRKNMGDLNRQAQEDQIRAIELRTARLRQKSEEEEAAADAAREKRETDVCDRWRSERKQELIRTPNAAGSFPPHVVQAKPSAAKPADSLKPGPNKPVVTPVVIPQIRHSEPRGRALNQTTNNGALPAVGSGADRQNAAGTKSQGSDKSNSKDTNDHSKNGKK